MVSPRDSNTPLLTYSEATVPVALAMKSCPPKKAPGWSRVTVPTPPDELPMVNVALTLPVAFPRASRPVPELPIWREPVTARLPKGSRMVPEAPATSPTTWVPPPVIISDVSAVASARRPVPRPPTDKPADAVTVPVTPARLNRPEALLLTPTFSVRTCNQPPVIPTLADDPETWPTCRALVRYQGQPPREKPTSSPDALKRPSLLVTGWSNVTV